MNNIKDYINESDNDDNINDNFINDANRVRLGKKNLPIYPKKYNHIFYWPMLCM